MKSYIVPVMLALTLLATVGPADAVVTNHWDFEETAPTTAPQVLDVVGGNHATFKVDYFGNICPDDTDRSTDVPTGIGSTQSLYFGGVRTWLDYYGNPVTGPSINSYLNLNSGISLPSTSDWSVAVWYKGTDPGRIFDTYGGYDASGWQASYPFGSPLFSNYMAANSSTSFSIIDADDQGSTTGDGKLSFVWYNYSGSQGGGYQYINSTSSVNDGQWHHLAWVQHGSTETMDLWVDGVKEVNAAPMDYSQSAYAGQHVYIDQIGMAYPNVAEHHGLMDEAYVFSHSLTQDDINTLMGVASYIPGDANQDNVVDAQDFTILKANYGQAGGWTQGDFNADNLVDAQDFTILKAHYGQSNPLVLDVPEPATLALLVLGGLLAVRRKK
jgi:hypothetical protein